MRVRRIGAAVAVAAAVAAGVVAVEQGGAAAADPVRTVVLPADVSMSAPQLGALSQGPAGRVFRVTGADGAARSVFLGANGAQTLAGSDPTAPAVLQGDTLILPAAPTGNVTAVAFRTVAGAALGSVTVDNLGGELYLGGAGPAALVSVPDGSGLARLVRRAPGAADVPLGTARVGAPRALWTDAAGALVDAAPDLTSDTRQLLYVDHASRTVTPLVTRPEDAAVQGTLLDATRVGWIEGATLHYALRTAPGTPLTKTLPVSTGQFVSGDAVGWLRPEPTVPTAARLLVRQPGATQNSDLGQLAAPVPDPLPGITTTSVLPTGNGGFLVAVAFPGAVGLVSSSGTFSTLLWSAQKLPAAVRQLAISGGRLAWQDESRIGGQTHSRQLVAEDGVPRALPAVDLGPPGVTRVAARGSRTLVDFQVAGLELYGGTSLIPTDPRAALVDDAQVTGWDGTSVLQARPSRRQDLTDLRTGLTVQEIAPSDVDGGFLYDAPPATGPSTGEVRRTPYPGGPPVTVVPPNSACPVVALDARQGDVLLRCGAGFRVHGPAGELVTSVTGGEARLGSGLLWRVVDRAGARMLTATAYRTPGATPVDVFPLAAGQQFAVDREGPWAARVGTDSRIEVALVPGVPVPPVAGRYVPVTPSRLYDSRTDGGPVVAGTDRSVQVAGIGSIPANVTDVAVSVTVTAPTASSWLAAYPDGRYGGSSTLNYTSGRAATTLAVVPVRNGKIALKVGAGSAHVLLDVLGHHAGAEGAGGSGHVPVAPARVLDTRTTTRLAAGEARSVRLAGVGGVPADARAVVLNATVVTPAQASWLSVSPTDSVTPTTVSFAAGRTTAAATVVPLSGGSAVLKIGAGQADVLLDVAGYIPATADLDWRQADYLASGPTRLLDTRTGTGTPVAAGQDRRVPVTGLAGVPRGATAVLLTVTAVRGSASGYVTAYPTGTAPTTSTVSYGTGETVANAALVPIGPDGSISVRVGAGSSHVLLDVAGYLQR